MSNVSCPHCGEENLNVAHGVKLQIDAVSFFSQLCYRCGQRVYYCYDGNHQMRLTPSIHSPLERQPQRG